MSASSDGPKHPNVGIVTFLLRIFRGFRYRLRIDRKAASCMVGIHDDYGQLASATEACRHAVKDDPGNLHAYLNMIDLTGRCMGDLARAGRYYELGLSTLSDPRDRELLESVYLYTRVFGNEGRTWG